MSIEWQDELVARFGRSLADRYGESISRDMMAMSTPEEEITVGKIPENATQRDFNAATENIRFLASTADLMVFALSQGLGNTLVTQLDFQKHQDSVVLVLAARLMRIAERAGFSNHHETVHPHILRELRLIA